MERPSNDSVATGGLRPTPELTGKLTDLWPIVVAGNVLWFLAFAVLLTVRLVSDARPDVWMWSAAAGFLLGFLGMAIMYWQRSASRRGAKGAQRNL
ncbi:hypothetical protein CFN78_24470 [Amycolatopsis antarctica]|uniref:DUF2530 domain-containing protein n=1 Tax=Amycolatopsis antarctica TaxID=1854586 RepID=A0A263CWP7_9PSEU|nr:DUF2530 domain-containing protein [Amycolatopsis antarctica]OZM70562.1 hypothetical protein CFN78_24470 [Amycolatopsis antarctica]